MTANTTAEGYQLTGGDVHDVRVWLGVSPETLAPALDTHSRKLRRVEAAGGDPAPQEWCTPLARLIRLTRDGHGPMPAMREAQHARDAVARLDGLLY